MLKIGLTGGIGSGKSTVANLFKAKSIDVIDLDQIARDVVEPGTIAIKEIAEHFGKTVLLENGSLNRKKLGDIVFNNAKEKAWLESLLHPLIHAQQELIIEQSLSPYIVIEIPLLVENKRQNDVDRVLLIQSDKKKQIERAILRGKQTEEQIKNIIALQATEEQRKKVADDIIENNGPEAELAQAIDQLHQQYLHLANQKST